MITIDIVNHSTVVNSADVPAVAAALQKQVSGDFAPDWGRDARIAYNPTGIIASGHWGVAILDDSDQAGALGYHDLTKAGLPLSSVFAKTDQKYGLSWTVTASHEILEMLGDPFINQTALAQSGPKKGRLYAFEACDPCEADELGYDIDGVKVSDFVLMAWFWAEQGGPYDFKGHLKAPFSLAKGGYVSYMDLTSRKGWQQEQDETAPPRRPGGLWDVNRTHENGALLPGSRRERRIRNGDPIRSTR